MDDIEKFVRSKLPGHFITGHVKPVVDEAMYLYSKYPKSNKIVVYNGAWLHDIGHIIFGEDYYNLKIDKGQAADHHVKGVALAKDYLATTKYSKKIVNEILHCIEAHRTSKAPDPKTLEARIVLSADNLAHFVKFDLLQSNMGLKFAITKLKRNLNHKEMLPEAIYRAEEFSKKIEEKYRVSITSA